MENLRELTLSEYRKYKSVDDKIRGSAEWLVFKQAFEKGYEFAESTRDENPLSIDSLIAFSKDYLMQGEAHAGFYKEAFINGFSKHREIFKRT